MCDKFPNFCFLPLQDNIDNALELLLPPNVLNLSPTWANRHCAECAKITKEKKPIRTVGSFLRQNRSAIVSIFELQTYTYFKLRARICILSPTHTIKDIRVFEIDTLSAGTDLFPLHTSSSFCCLKICQLHGCMCTYDHMYISDLHT